MRLAGVLLALALALASVPACWSTDTSEPVIVLVMDENTQPATGLRVVGHESHGNLVDEAVTDEAGLAVLHVPPGGSISVVDRPREDASSVVTVFGVEPGETIPVSVEREGRWAVPLAVTVPPLPAGADRFELHAPCTGGGGTATSTTMYVMSFCPTRGPLVVVALGPTGLVAYLEMPDVDLDRASLVVEGEWRPPTRSFTVDVTGFAADERSINFSRSTLFQGYPLAHHDGVIDAQGATGTTTRPRFAAGDGTRHRVARSNGSACIAAGQYIEHTVPGALDGAAMNLVELPAPITDVTASDAGEVRWTGGGDGAFVTVEIATARTPGGLAPDRSWRALAPTGLEPLYFPGGLGVPWPAENRADLALTTVREETSSRWATYAERRVAFPDGWRVEPAATRGAVAERFYITPECR